VLEHALAADRDDDLCSSAREREGGDQSRQDWCAVAGFGEHHDAEQDRDEAGEDELCAIAAVERKRKAPPTVTISIATAYAPIT